MLEKLLELKNRDNSLKEFVETVCRGVPSAVFGVGDAFKPYLAACLSCPVLYIARDGIAAAAAARELSELSHKKTVYIPAKDETLISSRAFSKDGLFARITALGEAEDAAFIVISAETAMQICPRSVKKLTFETGKDVDLAQTVRRLAALGYRHAEKAEVKGTFARRGDVLDIFPVNAAEPVRVDFFGDTVDTIKRFDPETGDSLGYADNITVFQALEFIFEEDDPRDFEKEIAGALSAASLKTRARMEVVAGDLYSALDNFDAEGMTALAPLSKDCGTVFDYLKEGGAVILDEARRIWDVCELYEREFTERCAALEKEGEIFPFAAGNLIGREKLKERITGFAVSALQTLSADVRFFNPLAVINPSCGAVADYRMDFNEAYTDIDNWLKGGYSVLICTGDPRRAERFCGDLSEHGIPSSLNGERLKGAAVTAETLSRGFIFHEEKVAVIGSGNLFVRSGEKPAAKAARAKKGFFTAPAAGDYCVHETHGIGRVLGNKKISTTEGTKDYVAVEYAGGDVLYVPVEQMDILTRYLGGEKHPRLSKIGGADFERIKTAARESIKKMSFDLKRLYSERSALKGFAFKSDEELEEAFDGAFPFEETPDQAAADRDIKEDMESGRVMDRLICGDVGFGKTEVAFRAVFRAVENGKQAAMLAPTTILTEQHYNTALKRFEGFGVKIACLNRFRTAAEQKRTVRALKEGEIDFIIGTHRLLSGDVGFKDLGLLILDEEQRFGVEHKEKIKLLRKNVDALTLTATPIPRTLHMSLSGIRSISVINTPPKKRLPVQTYVTEETDALFKDVISREVNRGGQVFILYNRVESIFSFSERIRKLLPGLKITVVHGQMEEKTMEKNVLSFYRGESDALISTTIIENGIDLPKANSLIVVDADKLGLSTLYQLKGRVGRSDRLAYAYFTYKRDKILSNVAFERLNAITEFTEMGSGIKIAMRDLEIRGAGNILGAEQHGHMDKIGYELYSKLLREELSGTEERVPDLDVRVTAFIPESYIESRTSRMDAYKEIAELSDFNAEREFVKNITENYGELPKEAENLILISAVKRLSMKLGAEKITVNKTEASITLSDFGAFKKRNLQAALDKNRGKVIIGMANRPKLNFVKEGDTGTQTLKKMRDFLLTAAQEEKDN